MTISNKLGELPFQEIKKNTLIQKNGCNFKNKKINYTTKIKIHYIIYVNNLYQNDFQFFIQNYFSKYFLQI